MKNKILTVLCALLFFVGLGVLFYPTVSNQWNVFRQSMLISDYDRKISGISVENFQEEWKTARDYNDSFEFNNIYSDAFEADDAEITTADYREVLNITGDGTMGYLEIPKIDLSLSINHGTSEEVLQSGIGHLEGSKLPIGGKGNHTILAAHRGLPSAKLFTDVDRLEIGDVFYLHVLDEVMAYQVDQILPMVDKDDVATLEAALQIVENEDYVTLFTCTPYGVNTHRLLVRGCRTTYVADEDVEPQVTDSMVERLPRNDELCIVSGFGALYLLIIFINFLFRPRKKRRTKIRRRV